MLVANKTRVLKEGSPAARLLVEPQNPNANSCCQTLPRVPTKMELIAPVFFELSCKQ